MNQISIGTKFKTAGKHPRLCEVVEIHTTRDSCGGLVKVEYVARHEIAGTPVIEHGIPAATIIRGMING